FVHVLFLRGHCGFGSQFSSRRQLATYNSHTFHSLSELGAYNRRHLGALSDRFGRIASSSTVSRFFSCFSGGGFLLAPLAFFIFPFDFSTLFSSKALIVLFFRNLFGGESRRWRFCLRLCVRKPTRSGPNHGVAANVQPASRHQAASLPLEIQTDYAFRP